MRASVGLVLLALPCCGPSESSLASSPQECAVSEMQVDLDVDIPDARLTALAEMPGGGAVVAGCLRRADGAWGRGLLGVDAHADETWRADFSSVDGGGCLDHVVVDADQTETWLWAAPGSSRLHEVRGAMLELSGGPFKLAPPGYIEPAPIVFPSDPEGSGRIEGLELAPRPHGGVAQVGRLTLDGTSASSAVVLALDAVQRADWIFVADDPAWDLWWIDAQYGVQTCGSHCVRFDDAGDVVSAVAVDADPNDPVIGFDRLFPDFTYAITRSGRFLAITDGDVEQASGPLGCAGLELGGGVHRVGARFHAPCRTDEADALICEIWDSLELRAVLTGPGAWDFPVQASAGADALWLLAACADADATSVRRLAPPEPGSP